VNDQSSVLELIGDKKESAGVSWRCDGRRFPVRVEIRGQRSEEQQERKFHGIPDRREQQYSTGENAITLGAKIDRAEPGLEPKAKERDGKG